MVSILAPNDFSVIEFSIVLLKLFTSWSFLVKSEEKIEDAEKKMKLIGICFYTIGVNPHKYFFPLEQWWIKKRYLCLVGKVVLLSLLNERELSLVVRDLHSVPSSNCC